MRKPLSQVGATVVDPRNCPIAPSKLDALCFMLLLLPHCTNRARPLWTSPTPLTCSTLAPTARSGSTVPARNTCTASLHSSVWPSSAPSHSLRRRLRSQTSFPSCAARTPSRYIALDHLPSNCNVLPPVDWDPVTHEGRFPTVTSLLRPVLIGPLPETLVFLAS